MNTTPSNAKIALSALLALSCYTTAYGSHIKQNMPTSTITGSITGLFLQPSVNNLQYAVYTTPLPLPAPNWYAQTIKPEYSASFDLELDYHFANGTDYIALDWLDFRSNDKAQFAATAPNTSVGPTYYFGPAEQFLLNTSANSSVDFVVDDVQLVAKHSVTLSQPIQIEPFIGVDSAYLKENTTNNYAGTDPVYGPYTHSTYLNSKFTGFGPRIGLDARYFASSNYGINASMAGSVLVGDLASSTDFTSWTGYTSGVLARNNTPANTTLSKLSQTVIVPKVDAKIGLFFTKPLHTGTSITAQAGYMFTAYLNAINQVLPSSLVPGAWEAGSVAIISQAQQQSTLSLNGPYLTLAWK
jgi:hypothetical protein